MRVLCCDDCSEDAAVDDEYGIGNSGEEYGYLNKHQTPLLLARKRTITAASPKLAPNFADRGCLVISATYSQGR
jgi:hypothetical protein